MPNFLTYLYILLIGLAGIANAWWCKGHMMVAQLARLELERQDHRDIIKWIDNLLEKPIYTDLFREYLEAACWPDDLVLHGGMKWTGIWHYVLNIYNPFDLPIPNERHITNNQLIIGFKNGNDSPLLKNTSLTRSMMLRFLIHFIGDVHVPLHAVTRYSKLHPDGDFLGLRFGIKYNSDIYNLHRLWDSVFNWGPPHLVVPVPASGLESVRKYSKILHEQYPWSLFPEELKIKDPIRWAKESYNLAVKEAYVGITEGEKPSKEYMERGLGIAQQRLVIAAYRLVLLLILIFHT